MEGLEQRSLLEIMEEHPEAEALFRSYDSAFGECVVCMRLFETPEGLEEKEPRIFKGLVKALEELIKG